MSENIKTLLFISTTKEEKINAVNNIITNYNLNLTIEEIMPIFTKARKEIDYIHCYANDFSVYEFLFEFLLNKNIDMFIAMIKYYSDKEKKIFWKLGWCVSPNRPFYVGSNNSCHIAVHMYKNFLDCHNFNIDNLVIPEECKEKIQEYRSEKYGGSLTKSAKK